MRPKQSPASHGGGQQIGCSSVHLCDPQHGVPHRFRRAPKSQTARARRAFKPNGPGERLVTALSGHAYLFTLTTADLEPSLSDDPSGLYGNTVSALLDRVARAFHGPAYAVAEVGKGSAPGRRGRLHCHVIAHRDDGPQHVPRGGERCKPVYDAPNLYRYLAKAPEPYTLEAHLDHSAAEVISATGKPPRTRRHFLGPPRLAWAEAQCTNGLTLNPAPSTRGEPAPQGGSTPLQPVTLNPEPSTLPDPTQRPAERPHPPVAKREQLEEGVEIRHLPELESTGEISQLTELKSGDGKTRPRKQKAKPKTQLRPPPARPSGHREITRPEPKRLPAPRPTRGDTSGPAP